jgi:hypothetical protein
VALDFPLKGGKGPEITELKLRGEPTVADLEAMDRAKGDVEKSRLLIADLSGVSPATLATMRVKDYMRVMEAVGAILGNE